MNIDLDRTLQYLDWTKEKIILNNIHSRAQTRVVSRGQVYYCKFGVGIGSEIMKERPCVILQNNTANRSSSNVIVAPITHTYHNIPTTIPIKTQLDKNGEIIVDGYVLLGSITCVNKARLGNKITKLPSNEIRIIDEAIGVSLNLRHYYSSLKNDYDDKLKHIEKLKEDKIKLNNELDEHKKIILDLQCKLKENEENFHTKQEKTKEILLIIDK